MASILITGGTGLVGRALVNHLLKKNYRVTILTRNMDNLKPEKGVDYALWDVKKGEIDVSAIAKADAIIHLAGAGVMDKKWTAEYKKEILESRTKSSELLIDTLRKNKHNVKVIVSASAIGWYGEDKIPGHLFTEDEPYDKDFLGEVCMQWEKSTEPAEQLGIRVCRLRTGIVLSKEGGAYPEFKASLKFGIASILGNGKQVISWIHIDDLCRAYIYALENEMMKGSYNAVAPAPVKNKLLTLTIADKVKGKFYIPVHVPQFVLQTMMGKRSIEILKSTAVSSEKIMKEGFAFLYPEIKTAIAAIEEK